MSETYDAHLTNAVMDLVDLLGANPESKVDPRAWKHLRIYIPADDARMGRERSQPISGIWTPTAPRREGCVMQTCVDYRGCCFPTNCVPLESDSGVNIPGEKP